MMWMKRLLVLSTMLCLGIALLPAMLQAQAKTPTKKMPFSLSSDRAEIDTMKNTMVCDGHVKFISAKNSTNLNCQHLEANSASRDKISHVIATGSVHLTMVLLNKDQAKPSYNVDGTAELVRYSLTDNNPVIRLLKDKDVTPRLILTDQKTKEPTVITGDMIEFNMVTGKATFTNFAVQDDGSAQ